VKNSPRLILRHDPPLPVKVLEPLRGHVLLIIHRKDALDVLPVRLLYGKALLLLDTEKVQVLGYTMYKEMIRLTGVVKPLPASRKNGRMLFSRSSLTLRMSTPAIPGISVLFSVSGI